MLLTVVFSLLLIPLITYAQDDPICFNIRDDSTWPKKVVEDLEACKADPGGPYEEELSRKHKKIKDFMQKTWDKLIKRVTKEERQKILDCMWSKQRFFDLEGNVIDWDEVDNVIDSMQISEERKESLKAAVEKCIEDNDQDGKPRVEKMAKCFVKQRCFKAACPKKPGKETTLCKMKGPGGPKKDQGKETGTEPPEDNGDEEEEEEEEK